MCLIEGIPAVSANGLANMGGYLGHAWLYVYVDSHLNVAKVKRSDKIVTIPYSAGGFVVNAFSPTQPLPDAVEELVLGQNIIALTNGEGIGGTFGPEANGTKVVKIHIDPNNSKPENYEGVIYKKNSSVPYFIPHRLSTDCPQRG